MIFVPIVFIEGVSGKLFSELGYTVMFSLTCSMFVSLSLVPMFASKMLRIETGKSSPADKGTTQSQPAKNSWTNLLNTTYSSLLKTGLHNRWSVITGTLALLAMSFLLVPYIGTNFLPPSD